MSISLIQQTNQVQGASNPTLSLSGIAAGNTLVLQFESDTNFPPGVIDTAGNNWQIAVSFVWNDGSSNRCIGIAYASGVAGGSNTITVITSVNTRIAAQEFSSGVSTPLILDQVATGTGSGTSFSTSSVTTLVNDELLVGTFFDKNSSSHSSFTPGSGYTGLNGFTATLFSEYQVVGSTGSYNATASSSSSSVIWGGALATFAAAPLPVFNTIVGRFNSAGTLVGRLLAPIWTSVNVTPVTVNANSTADQNLMSVLIPANTLNSVGRTLKGRVKGLYSTPVASTATIEIKVQLGTLTLLDIVTSANPGTVTNNPFNLEFDITTQTAGASAKFETSGKLSIDLGAATSSAGSTFLDTNTAVSSTLDITQNQTLQITIAFSSASASNTATQRQLVLNTVD